MRKYEREILSPWAEVQRLQRRETRERLVREGSMGERERESWLLSPSLMSVEPERPEGTLGMIEVRERER